MVKSEINSEIEYKDNLQIDSQDIGFQSSLYELEIFDRLYVITIGKPNYTYTKKNVIYYPIYIVDSNTDAIRGQIGLFEFLAGESLNYLDDENELDLTKLKNSPLFYNFVNSDFMSKIVPPYEPNEEVETVSPTTDENNKPEVIDISPENIDIDTNIDIDIEKSPEEEPDEDDITALKIPKSGVPPVVKPTTKEDIFKIDTEMKTPMQLAEETKETAAEIKKNFKESPQTTWIQNFLKNENYEIIENEGAGDCFFAVVRDAYAQIGHITTVQKLREILAEEADDSLFRNYRELYLSIENDIKETDKQMESLKQVNGGYKQRAKQLKDKQELAKMLEEAKRNDEEYKKLKGGKSDSEKFLTSTVGFMKNIDTLDKLKEFIKTSDYWADAWAISTLEYKLNMKMIILSQQSYNEDALDSVLMCGEANKNIESQGTFNPNYYIITAYRGDHYELVSYKKKHILTYREIPYDIKTMIVNKCMERNSGIYYMIQDFRNLKSKLGIHPDEGMPEEKEDAPSDEVYDPDIVFMFHGKSEKSAKPGKGSNETIPEAKRTNYIALSKVQDWRRMLDDSWTSAPFQVDNHRWLSVEHYYQASKFKKGFPDFYEKFTLDSNTDISKDVALAEAAGGKSGKLKDRVLRPKTITIDPDFYGGRDLEERKTALDAKFSKNEDMKQVLLATYPAKLIHFTRGSPPETDTLLMKVRKEMK